MKWSFAGVSGCGIVEEVALDGLERREEVHYGVMRVVYDEHFGHGCRGRRARIGSLGVMPGWSR